VLTGVFLGKSELDAEPDEFGWWSDLWLDAGEKRLALVARLRARGAQIFGSSQPVPGSVAKAGRRIDAWAHMMQTLSTSPQNTLSIIQPVKAILDQMPEDIALAGIRTVLSELHNLGADPDATLLASVKAKNERALSNEDEARWQKFVQSVDATSRLAEQLRQ
jgi:hypothetical protein